jgi:ethanolamine transporter
LTQLASSIPVWSVMGDMNNRGKLLNVAFAVSGAFVFGDVLAFTGGVNPEMIFPVIVAKLSGGILAILLAILLVKKKILNFE